jgi:hypothetical protein
LGGGASTQTAVVASIFVFKAEKSARTFAPTKFAPMEHSSHDDESVYPVPHNKPVAAPTVAHTLHVRRALGGLRTRYFESFIAGVFVLAMLDRGATHSFVSLKFCRENDFRFRSFPSSAISADSCSIEIVGEIPNALSKMDSFRTNFSFLVVDM